MGNKLTTQKFIDKASIVHSRKYDYSVSNYSNSRTKIKIICQKHGEFEQLPSNHLFGNGCPKCAQLNTGNILRMTHNDFVNRCDKIHNQKYNYSLVNYIDNDTKVRIICPIHGEFEQTPQSHLSGSECNKCSHDKLRKSQLVFINKASLVHTQKYNYSLVEYKNNKTKIKIICPIHGEFEQTPQSHLNGCGCNKCGNSIKSKDFFISESLKVHGDYYDYSEVEFIDTNTKVKIICPIHGEFLQRAGHHYRGSGCLICNESKGERIIRQYLIDKNIEFVPQKRFKDCKDIRPLPFDFYLPKINTCIEFDGEQHFKIKEAWGGIKALENTQKRDKIKTDYCINNNIKLIRLNNDNITNIKEII